MKTKLIQRTGNMIRDIIDKHIYLAYPILGNLSGKVQERIEKATNESYNAEKATITSFFTNALAYGGFATYEMSRHIPTMTLQDGFWDVFFPVTLLSGTLGGMLRNYLFIDSQKKCGASLPGKIASLPLEGVLGIYDRLKSKEENRR